jgi:hypothetical protein
LRYLPGGIWAPASRFVTAGGPRRRPPRDRRRGERPRALRALAVGGVALALAGDPGVALRGRRGAWPVLEPRRAGAREPPGPRAQGGRPAQLPGAFVAYALFAGARAEPPCSGWDSAARRRPEARPSLGRGLVVIITPAGGDARAGATRGPAAGDVAQAGRRGGRSGPHAPRDDRRRAGRPPRARPPLRSPRRPRDSGSVAT